MISSRGESEYRIAIEYPDGRKQIVNDYFTKSEAIRYARILYKHKPAYYTVYHEYSEREVFHIGKRKANPSIPKDKWIKTKAIKIGKGGRIDIKVERQSNPKQPKKIYYDPYKGKYYTLGRFGKRVYRKKPY